LDVYFQQPWSRLTMGSTLLIVAVTVGGPVGISPEIIPKAFSDPRACRCCGIVIDGRAARVEAGMATTGSRFGIAEISSIDAMPVGYDGITVINAMSDDIGSPAWKKPTTAPGTAMVAYLNTAIDDAMAARISAIATGPRLP
jgi:4-hydroxy-L-threonine phosphate dehydrogenase PdxA